MVDWQRTHTSRKDPGTWAKLLSPWGTGTAHHSSRCARIPAPSPNQTSLSPVLPGRPQSHSGVSPHSTSWKTPRLEWGWTGAKGTPGVRALILLVCPGVCGQLQPPRKPQHRGKPSSAKGWSQGIEGQLQDLCHCPLLQPGPRPFGVFVPRPPVLLPPPRQQLLHTLATGLRAGMSLSTKPYLSPDGAWFPGALSTSKQHLAVRPYPASPCSIISWYKDKPEHKREA